MAVIFNTALLSASGAEQLKLDTTPIFVAATSGNLKMTD
jgi:hypothetical protein